MQAYRFYVTEAMKAAVNNTATIACHYGEALNLNQSYIEFLDDIETTKKDLDKAEEEAESIKERFKDFFSD
jgi:hypothetical protein